MKRFVLPLLAALCSLAPAAAQDRIMRKNAATIEAKVLEITPEAVRYKRFSNPDGPTYVLPVGDIRWIEYANGERETFAEPEQRSDAATPAAVASATAPGGANAEVRKYEVGDYFEQGDVRGVVCEVTDDGRHGLLISLDQIYLPWSTFRKPDLRTVGADDSKDGRVNMECVARYIEEHGLDWSDFPAFEWCRAMGEGWYLPSIDELLAIGNNYNGGSRMRTDRQARNRFNDALKDHGGKRMDRLVYYFSSTEVDPKNAYTTHTSIEPPYVVEIPKYNKFLVRAVRRF